MRILICEDSEQNLQSAREFAEKVKGEHEVVMLERAGWAVAEVGRSGQVISSVSHPDGRVTDVRYGDKVDCVLTDLYLPTSKGTSLPGGLCVALAALQLGVPVAIITDGNAHGDDELVAMLSGVQNQNERLQRFIVGQRNRTGVKGETPDGRLIKDWEFCFNKLIFRICRQWVRP